MPRRLAGPRNGILLALPYLGGKSAWYGTGRWIADQLPWFQKMVYSEPFGGMAGVMLQRKPSLAEFLNDLDGQVYGWWCCIRDHSEELEYLVRHTPFSEDAFAWAKEAIGQHENCCYRALALTVLLTQALPGRDEWAPDWVMRISVSPATYAKRIARLAQRMERVRLSNEDAVEFVGRFEEEEATVMYCDPPYAGTMTTYAHDVDRQRLAEALRPQKGYVAISGYGEEWDELLPGWRKVTRFQHAPMAAYSSKPKDEDREAKKPNRVECLWMNYPDLGEETRHEQPRLGLQLEQ